VLVRLSQSVIKYMCRANPLALERTRSEQQGQV
jgi:hypothetical protein